MIDVIASVLVGAAFTVALLFITRRRLARQFSDIQRRLLQLEHSVANIENRLDRSTTEVQLQRLHRGLIRVEESLARRYGALVPLAREIERRGPDALRFPDDFQLSGLAQWSRSLGLSLSRDEIAKLARIVAQAESGEAGPIPMGTIDLLARMIPLLRWRGGPVIVAVAGEKAASLAPVLGHLAPAFFDRIDIQFTGTGPVDVLFADSMDTDVDGVVDGGLLVAPTSEEGSSPSGFALVACEWQVAIHQKALVS